MRAVVFRKAGPVEVLELTNIPMPEPEEGEVRVRLLSMGLNRADALFREEKYFIKPQFNLVDQGGPPACRIGMEGAGIVDAVGQGAPWQVGDRVAIMPLRVNPVFQGTFAEYGLYRSQDLFPLPNGLSESLSGAIWMMYLTAWGGMVSEGKLIAGETVVITAASSSVGIASIQIAKLMGARVVATSTSDDKKADLLQAGADVVINMLTEDYVARMKDFSQGRGSDLVFDAVAGPGIRHLIQGSRRGGRVVIHGMLDRRPMDVHAGVLMKRLLNLSGFTLDKVMDDPALREQGLKFVGNGLTSGVLKPAIAGVFPLARFKEAFDLMESNAHVGKIILVP